MPCEATQKYNQPAVLAQTFGILQPQLMITPAITIENYSPIDVRVARFATCFMKSNEPKLLMVRVVRFHVLGVHLVHEEHFRMKCIARPHPMSRVGNFLLAHAYSIVVVGHMLSECILSRTSEQRHAKDLIHSVGSQRSYHRAHVIRAWVLSSLEHLYLRLLLPEVSHEHIQRHKNDYDRDAKRNGNEAFAFLPNFFYDSLCRLFGNIDYAHTGFGSYFDNTAHSVRRSFDG